MGFKRGGDLAAAVYIRIGTAKLNDVALQSRLADLLTRIVEMPNIWLHAPLT